jgi:hypothetical protein
VVSLTALPRRFGTLHLVLESVLEQVESPTRVALWLTHAHAPTDAALPGAVRRLMRHGVSVGRVATDWPHQKLLPALQAYPDADILTVDDDIVYPPSMVGGLRAVARRHPGTVVGQSTRTLTVGPDGRFLPYLDWPKDVPEASVPSPAVMPQGMAGVLYPAGIFPGLVHDAALAARLSPRNDDLWVRAVLLTVGVPGVRALTAPRFGQVISEASQRGGLLHGNVLGGDNDRQWAALAEHFGLGARHLQRTPG